MQRLSLNMVVYNEEGRLRQMLEATRPLVDEVVIVVQQSTDNTLAIARELADIVIEHPCYGFSEPSRQAAYDASTGDWFIQLDADEYLTEYGIHNLRFWIENGRADYYRLRRLTLIDGVELEDAAHGRLFRRGAAIIPTHVHTDYWAAPGAVQRVLMGQVVINHFKTGAEQRYDDERGQRGYRPE